MAGSLVAPACNRGAGRAGWLRRALVPCERHQRVASQPLAGRWGCECPAASRVAGCFGWRLCPPDGRSGNSVTMYRGCLRTPRWSGREKRAAQLKTVRRHEIVEENRLIVGTSNAVLSSRPGWPERVRLASTGGPGPSASGGNEGGSCGASLLSWCRGPRSASWGGRTRRSPGRMARSFAGPGPAVFGTVLSRGDLPIVGPATASYRCCPGGWMMVRTASGGSARHSGATQLWLRATVVPPHRKIAHREGWSAGAGLRKAAVPFEGWSAKRSQDVVWLPSNPPLHRAADAAGERQQRSPDLR